MNDFDKMLAELQLVNSVQSDLGWTECIPWKIWNTYFAGKKYKEITAINIVEHEQYYTAVKIVFIGGRYLGIDLIMDTKDSNENEEMELCDYKRHVKYLEMKTATCIGYEKR